MSKWVNVNERLPLAERWYLIVANLPGRKRKTVTMAFLDHYDTEDNAAWLTHNDNTRDEWLGVTCWMELPDIPSDLRAAQQQESGNE